MPTISVEQTIGGNWIVYSVPVRGGYRRPLMTFIGEGVLIEQEAEKFAARLRIP